MNCSIPVYARVLGPNGWEKDFGLMLCCAPQKDTKIQIEGINYWIESVTHITVPNIGGGHISYSFTCELTKA